MKGVCGGTAFTSENIYVFNERTLFDLARLLLVFGTLPPMNCLESAEQPGWPIVLTWKNSLTPAVTVHLYCFFVSVDGVAYFPRVICVSI